MLEIGVEIMASATHDTVEYYFAISCLEDLNNIGGHSKTNVYGVNSLKLMIIKMVLLTVNYLMMVMRVGLIKEVSVKCQTLMPVSSP